MTNAIAVNLVTLTNVSKITLQVLRCLGLPAHQFLLKALSTSVYGKRTTKDLFNECLHKYVITDAIRDENVLKFSVEYIQTIKQKDNVTDIDVEDIDTAEVMEADERIDAITDYIIENHNRKTHSREFNAIFCTSSIKSLIKYYELLKQKKDVGKHTLKIGAIFSYQVNEDDSDANGFH